jgi:hypothetical protein
MRLTMPAAAGTAAVAALFLAACGGSISQSGSAPASRAASPAAAPASSAPAPAPQQVPLGTPFSVSDDEGNTITVVCTQVIDPARGADEFTTPDSGKRFVGVVFTITGKSGTFSDDANADAFVAGSDGQLYEADFDAIAGYTNFNAGEYTVVPGVREVGAVTFQLPASVKVASVQWGQEFSGDAPARWVP